MSEAQRLDWKTSWRCWDGMPDPRVSLEDLDTAAIVRFRKRVGTAKRLAGNALDEDDARLIDRPNGFSHCCGTTRR